MVNMGIVVTLLLRSEQPHYIACVNKIYAGATWQRALKYLLKITLTD